MGYGLSMMCKRYARGSETDLNIKVIWYLLWNNMKRSLLIELCINKETFWLLVSQATRFYQPFMLGSPSIFSGPVNCHCQDWLLADYLLEDSSMAMLRGCKKWNQGGELRAIQYGSWEGIMRTQGLSEYPPVIFFSYKQTLPLVLHHKLMLRIRTAHQNVHHVAHTFSISERE